MTEEKAINITVNTPDEVLKEILVELKAIHRDLKETPAELDARIEAMIP